MLPHLACVASAGEFSGAITAIRSITKVEGMRGLFAGYGSFLLRDLPFDAIEFVAYEQLKRSYKASLKEDRDPNSLETSAIGERTGLGESNKGAAQQVHNCSQSLGAQPSRETEEGWLVLERV